MTRPTPFLATVSARVRRFAAGREPGSPIRAERPAPTTPPLSVEDYCGRPGLTGRLLQKIAFLAVRLAQAEASAAAWTSRRRPGGWITLPISAGAPERFRLVAQSISRTARSTAR